MPPTPEQSQIEINANLYPQAPQVSEEIINPKLTSTATQEGEISMPDPRMWIGEIDYGMNWNTVGALAFEVAGNMYEKTLDYQIDKKGADISDAIHDSEAQIYDSFNVTNLDSSGNSMSNDIDSVTEFYRQKQTELKAKINSIIGNDIFSTDFSFDGYGSKWFSVIEGARSGYSALAKAGEKVQKDTLITMGKKAEMEKNRKNWADGSVMPQEGIDKVNDEFVLPWDQEFPVTSKEVVSGRINPKYIQKKADGTFVYIGGEAGWRELPDDIKEAEIFRYVQASLPRQGSLVPSLIGKLAHTFAESTTNQENDNGTNLFLHVLPYLSYAQLTGLQKYGTNLNNEQMQKIIAARAMSDAKLSVFKIQTTLSSVNQPALHLTSLQMGQIIGDFTPNILSPGRAEREDYDEKFIAAIGIENSDELRWQLENNTDIKDMYSTGLLISNLTHLSDTEKESIIESLTGRLRNNSSVLISKEQIQDEDTGLFRDKEDGHTIFTMTNIDSLNTSNPILEAQDEELSIKVKDNPGWFYYATQEAVNSPNRNIKLAYASFLNQPVYGVYTTHATQIQQSVDKTYNLSRSLMPDWLEKLDSVQIRQVDRETGAHYAGGPSESEMLRYAIASSDEVLYKYNGGKRPRNPEEVNEAFKRALDDIPPADQWVYEPDTSNDSLSSRGNTLGDASIGMRLVSIPLNGRGKSPTTVDGLKEVDNLLNDTSIFDAEFRKQVINNKITGRAMIPFRDYKDKNNMPDIKTQQQDRYDYIKKVLDGTLNDDMIISETKFTRNNLDTYVLREKSNAEISKEISSHLVKTGRGSSYTHIDNSFLGKSSDIDTKEEFAIAVRNEFPFLVLSTKNRLGISIEQAEKLYINLLSSDALYSVYDRNVGNLYFHALADITLSASEYITNGMPEKQKKPVDIKVPAPNTLKDQQKHIDTSNDFKPSNDPKPIDFSTTSGEFKPSNDFKPLDFSTKATTQSTVRPISPGSVRGSSAGDFITTHENLKTHAYFDHDGKVWTIGKGTTKYEDGSPVKEGDIITKEKAHQLMENYINNKVIPELEKTIPTWSELNRNQRDALISFAYNVGEHFYGKKGYATISSALASTDTLVKVPDALKLYNKSGGKVLNGLITRRKAEGDLWNSVVR